MRQIHRPRALQVPRVRWSELSQTVVLFAPSLPDRHSKSSQPIPLQAPMRGKTLCSQVHVNSTLQVAQWRLRLSPQMPNSLSMVALFVRSVRRGSFRLDWSHSCSQMHTIIGRASHPASQDRREMRRGCNIEAMYVNAIYHLASALCARVICMIFWRSRRLVHQPRDEAMRVEAVSHVIFAPHPFVRDILQATSYWPMGVCRFLT